MAGLPQVVSSASVLAPARHSTRCGPAVALGHVVQKWGNFCLQPCLGIGLGYCSSIGQAGLMHQAQARLMSRQQGRRLHHRLIDAMGSLTTAKYEQVQLAVSLSGSGSSDLAQISSRTGVPVTHWRPGRYAALSGKEVNTRWVKRARPRTVIPGTRFCSMSTRGTRSRRLPAPLAP